MSKGSKRFSTLPYRVHTNREFGMMLRGEKPLAVFADAEGAFPKVIERYLRFFDRQVKIGRFVRHDHILLDQFDRGFNTHMILFALPDHTWRIEAMIELKQSDVWSPEHERQEGHLLGYEDWQNDIWIGLSSA